MKITKTLESMNSKEQKLFLKKLNEQFGITKLPDFVFMRRNDDKIFVTNREIELLPLNMMRVETAGLYIGKEQVDGFRPSIEGAQILGPLANKNILSIDLNQKHEWMKGNDLKVEHKDAIVLLKWSNDFLGSGKVRDEKLFNSVPKARRLSVVNENIQNQ